MENNPIDILLIEDSYHDAEMVKWALVQNCMRSEVLHLKNGEAALEYIQQLALDENSIQQLPKVILLDLKMPKVDGLAILKEVKESELLRKIPVVILTSSKEPRDIDNCYSLGANSYIVKPSGFTELCKMVGDVGYYWIEHNEKYVQHSSQVR